MPESFTLHQDAHGRLVFTDAEGRQHADVYPVRAFPLSAPAAGLAICDREGAELAWIADLADLAPGAAELLAAALADREFMPRIIRLVRVNSAAEPSEWEVETDRGPAHFLVRHDEDVRRLDSRRAMVVDAHGMRYLIEDLQNLDAPSRRLLERYL